MLRANVYSRRPKETSCAFVAPSERWPRSRSSQHCHRAAPRRPSQPTAPSFAPASSDELTNLTAAVHAANPDNPWWPHVNDTIRGGILADTKIYTDYTAESTEDMVQLVALCDAFLNQIATSTSLVAVYGTVTHHELKIDGSVEEHFDERYKLASGGKSDGEGACLANPYYENVLDELMKLGVETQVFSTEASEPGEVQG